MVVAAYWRHSQSEDTVLRVIVYIVDEEIASQRVKVEIVVRDPMKFSRTRCEYRDFVITSIRYVCVRVIAVRRGHVYHQIREKGFRFVIGFSFDFKRLDQVIASEVVN